MRPAATLRNLSLLAVLALAGSCPPPGGGGGDPCQDFPGVCLDLAAWTTEAGQGARVRRAVAEDLIGGEAAQGRVGDWSLRNERIRLIVQGEDRHMGPAPYGGNILDADLVRAPGEPGRDTFGELGLLLNFGRTLLPTDIRVWRDGSEGGSAILAVTGRDTINDFLNVPVLLEGALGSAGRLWMETEGELGLTITHFYILDPGAERVRIVTALRNDGQADTVIAVGDLFDRGGEAFLFNPARTQGSPFGYTDMLPERADDYLGLVGRDIAYAYDPVGVPGQEDDPNLSLTVSGVTGLIIGAEDLFDFTGEASSRPPPGALRLAPGQVHVVERALWVGADPAAITAGRDALAGVAQGVLSGTIAVADAQPLPPQTRIAALDAAGRPYTIFFEDDGRFSGRLPAGTWTLVADAPGHPFSAPVVVELAGGGITEAHISVPAAARVRVGVRTPAGAPSPAKVTFICSATCPKDLSALGGRFRDTGYDPLPRDVQHVGLVGALGEETFRLPPGSYQVVVSRGAEWSVFPPGWPQERHTLELGEGASELDAVIAPVVDSAGWISADLHVHALNSPDSPVGNRERILTYLAEGVDVIVATDHDYVTDYRPVIAALGAEAELAAVSGDEVTTFEWGHFNVFPLEPQDDVNGGALDWGGGEGPTLTPAQLFEAAHAQPGPTEKVVQINHPRGALGHLSGIGLDTGSGRTTTDPARFRMPTDGVVPGDTGLFSTNFTALELMNGNDLGLVRPLLGDWFAFLQRGLVVTATAVSDTHRWYSDGVGSPRSWVRVGAGQDTPATFDQATFVSKVNAGALFGGNGPFVRLTASAGAQRAEMGEVLSVAPGTEVTLTVEVQAPTWLPFETIELYGNVDGTDTRPDGPSSPWPTPTQVAAIDLSTETPQPGAFPGAEAATPHRRFVVERSFTVTASHDGWYLAMVRGSGSLFPVILERETGAFAFTNPVFLDTDGDRRYGAPRTFERAPEGIAAPTLPEPSPRRLGEPDLERLRERFAH